MKKITIARWKELGEFFIAQSGLNSFIYGAQDEDIIAKIKELKLSQYPVLVGILPSIMGTGSHLDAMGHESPMFFYCMVPKGNMSDAEVDTAWETTLDRIQQIEETIRENCNSKDWREFYHIQPDSIHIDPEFDMWGCMGWSIRFEMQYAD